MSDLTPLEDALKIVLDTVPVLGIEKINLLDALGRVLAEDIIADRDNPPWGRGCSQRRLYYPQTQGDQTGRGRHAGDPRQAVRFCLSAAACRDSFHRRRVSGS